MGAAIEAGTAGEEAIAVADLTDILIGAAGCHDRSGAAFFPHVNIFLCVEGNDALAGRAGGGLDADAVLEVGAQKSVGICFTQIVFGEERKLSDIIDTLDVLRLYTFLFHQIAVVGDVVIDVFDLFDDLFVLDFENLFPRRGFDFFLVVAFHFHCGLPFRTSYKLWSTEKRKSVAQVNGPHSL